MPKVNLIEEPHQLNPDPFFRAFPVLVFFSFLPAAAVLSGFLKYGEPLITFFHFWEESRGFAVIYFLFSLVPIVIVFYSGILLLYDFYLFRSLYKKSVARYIWISLTASLSVFVFLVVSFQCYSSAELFACFLLSSFALCSLLVVPSFAFFRFSQYTEKPAYTRYRGCEDFEVFLFGNRIAQDGALSLQEQAIEDDSGALSISES